MGVILRSKATKNLIVTGSAEILRFAQNDMEEFLDGHYLVSWTFLILVIGRKNQKIILISYN